MRRVSLNGPTMGSRWTAVWYDDGTPDPMAVGRALVGAVGAVDDQMSTWKPDSALMRLNRAPVGVWQTVPPQLATVLRASLDIRRISGGAFDIGVGRLVADWGFGAHASAPAVLSPAPSLLAVDTLQVDAVADRVRKRAPTALDLSGIAKGYGVDELARVLAEAGIDRYLVGIDGEMRARGLKPDGNPWALAVERPDLGIRAAGGVLTLTDAAVATSGDYRQRRDGDTGPVSHTIDPRTGRPVRNAVAAVTVLAGCAMAADAYATAILVLGPDAGEPLARHAGLDVLMLIRNPDGSCAERGTGRFAASANAEACA